jgi:peptidoglycan/LPS O-acetylase OafA/YrhL
MEKASRNYSLDFLKILGAIVIVLHHFQAIVGVKYNVLINFSGDWFNWGLFVELFFILSGYFMYRYIPKIQEGGITLSEWWKKRAVRLLPMSAITVVVFTLILFINNNVFGFGALWGMKVSIWDTIIAAFGIQEGWVFKNPIINNSIWYISALMFCYILFYIVTAFSARIKCNPMYFYIAIILLGLAIGVYGIDKPFMNWQMARGYYAFFFGILFAYYMNKYGVRRREIIASLITIIFFTLLFIFYPEYGSVNTNYMVTFFVFPAWVILFETKAMHKVFRHKIWETVSGISFEVYLWHLPLMLLMYLIMNLTGWRPPFENMASMYIFLIITWAFATLMYFFAERPITRRLTKNTKNDNSNKELQN